MARPWNNVCHTIGLPAYIFPCSKIERECLTSVPHSVCQGNCKEIHGKCLVKEKICIYIKETPTSTPYGSTRRAQLTSSILKIGFYQFKVMLLYT
jgi:hypothetical protein